MREPGRPPKTPILMTVLTQAVVGALIILCALLIAYRSDDKVTLLTSVCMGAVGGLLLGVALGSQRHRRALIR